MIISESGLKFPEADDFYNIEDFNDNTRIVENELKRISAQVESLTARIEGLSE